MKINKKKEVLVKESDAILDGSDTSSNDVSITNPFDPSKIRVDTDNAQMDALIKRIRNGEIVLTPEFQREAGVWNNDTQSRLIESMMIRIPLPAFYLDATNEDKWLVVDGLQRLTTIDRFVIKKELSLSRLEFLTEYNGMKFDELPRSLQRRIEETKIVMYLIQPGTPDKVKYDIFRRINTGGEPLSQQEIRHALNQGKITPFLKELATDRVFKKATDDGVSSKRMEDRECVLRFIAFSMTPPTKYREANFDQFLNEAMAKVNKFSVNELEIYKKRFLSAMKAAYDIFGSDAFRKRYSADHTRYPVNKALFESWSVNLGNLESNEIDMLVRNKEIVKNKFWTLMRKSSEFESAISQGTGSIKRVKLRFMEIDRIIREVIS